MANVYGYDLGDGDTIVSKINNNEKAVDLKMPGMKNEGIPIPSIYSFSDSNEVLVGYTALASKKLEELCINFKLRPTELSPEERTKMEKSVVAFTDAVFLSKEMVDQIGVENTTNDKEIIINIGYPTKWNQQDARLYREMLNKCTFKQKYQKKGKTVTFALQHESKAALLNTIYGSRENLLAKVQNGDFIVVFDFGSSTTDVTLISRKSDYHLEDLEEGDHKLGARLIERGIFKLVAEEMAKEQAGDSGGSRGFFASILEMFAERKPIDSATNRCIFKCREAKEIYFNTSSPDEKSEDYWYSRITGIKRVFPLQDYFSSQLMKKALELKWPELGNRTYLEGCKDVFQRVAKKMREMGRRPSLIILTGGASRMGFIRKSCEDAFRQNGKCPVISLDNEPSSAISRGLVYSVVADNKAQELEQEFRNVRDRVPGVLKNKMPSLAQKIARKLATPIVAIIKDEVVRWKNGGYVTLNSMKNEIEREIRDYLSSQTGKAEVNGAVMQWLGEEVGMELDRDISRIAGKYSVSYDPDTIQNVFKKVKVDNGGNISIPPIGGGIENIIKGAIQNIILKTLPIVLALLMPIIMMIILPMVISLVAGIVTVIGTIIFGLLGTVIPGGWAIIAAIVGVTAVVIMLQGWEAAKQRFMSNVSSYDLPMLVREAVTMEKLTNAINQETRDLSSQIANGLTSSSDFTDKLPRELSSGLQNLVESLTAQITLDFT